jgi:ketosteroid isomerase-like protein
MRNAADRAAWAVFDAINSRDLSALDDAVTPDFVDHGSPIPLPPGPDGYRTILTWVTQVLKVTYTVDDYFSTDDRIVVRATAHGVGVDAVHGPGREGRPFDMSTIHVFRTEGDKLAEHWGVRDELSVLIQLGAIPAPVIA